MRRQFMNSPRVVSLAELKLATSDIDSLVRGQEEGFVKFSRGEVDVPPVGHLSVPDVDGECHIKYGIIRGDSVFVVKAATGFYQNQRFGIPSSNGLMLVFSAETGQVLAVLLDEGY